jgi:hypothetical protein
MMNIRGLAIDDPTGTSTVLSTEQFRMDSASTQP